MDRRGFVVAGLAVMSCGVGQAPAERLRQTAVSRFGRDRTALQRAIDSGAAEILVDTRVDVDADVTLRSGQTLRFAGGAIHVPRGARFNQAVLYARGAGDVAIVDPVIDASAVPGGVTGIRLVDVTGIRIDGGRLTRANLMLESYNNAVDRRVRVSGTTVDLQGVKATAVYLSGLRGVAIDRLACANGLEGVGIYNHARAIRLVDVTARDHRQDGFLVYAGQDVAHARCRASGNGQSGFTTQRDASGEDTRLVAWDGCEAWDNGYDGFDIRGAKEAPWKVDTGFALTRCTARANGNCGFYVVMAEGSRVEDCSASRNRKQNLFVDTSDAVTVTGFRSMSGAAGVAGGPNKAGILVYNSADVDLRDVASDDTRGNAAPVGSQEFGVAFTGCNPRSRLSGGRFRGNRIAPVYADRDVTVVNATAR